MKTKNLFTALLTVALLSISIPANARLMYDDGGGYTPAPPATKTPTATSEPSKPNNNSTPSYGVLNDSGKSLVNTAADKIKSDSTKTSNQDQVNTQSIGTAYFDTGKVTNANSNTTAKDTVSAIKNALSNGTSLSDINIGVQGSASSAGKSVGGKSADYLNNQTALARAASEMNAIIAAAAKAGITLTADNFTLTSTVVSNTNSGSKQMRAQAANVTLSTPIPAAPITPLTPVKPTSTTTTGCLGICDKTTTTSTTTTTTSTSTSGCTVNCGGNNNTTTTGNGTTGNPTSTTTTGVPFTPKGNGGSTSNSTTTTSTTSTSTSGTPSKVRPS